jgi:hypothetical protein
MATIFVADLAFTTGPTRSAVEPAQAFVRVAAIALMWLIWGGAA